MCIRDRAPCAALYIPVKSPYVEALPSDDQETISNARQSKVKRLDVYKRQLPPLYLHKPPSRPRDITPPVAMTFIKSAPYLRVYLAIFRAS